MSGRPDMTLHVRGCFGYGNIGSDASLLAIKQREGSAIYLADHVVPGQVVRDRYGIEYRLLRDLKGGERVAIGGGTLLHARAFPGDPFARQALALLNRGCDVAWDSVGVESVSDAALVREAMERARAVTVRDEESAAVLHAIGVRRSVEVVGDPVERWLIHVPHAVFPEPVVGLNVKRIQEETAGPPETEEENHIAYLRLCRAILADTRWEIELFPFSVHVVDPLEDDSVLTRQLAIELASERVHLYSGAHHPVDALADMGRLSAFVGVRLHSLLFARRAGIPTFAIGRSSKCIRHASHSNVPFFDIRNPSAINELTVCLQSIKGVPRPEQDPPVIAAPSGGLQRVSSPAVDESPAECGESDSRQPTGDGGGAELESAAQTDVPSVSTAKRLAEREAELAAIYGSTTWRVVVKLRALAVRALPAGSWRARLRPTSGRLLRALLAPQARKCDVRVHCDEPAGEASRDRHASGAILVRGWAIAETGVVRVCVFCDGRRDGDATYGLFRPDVGAAWPRAPHAAQSGFQYSLDTYHLTDGAHEIGIEATARNGKAASITIPIVVDNTTDSYSRWLRHTEVTGGDLDWMRRAALAWDSRPRIALLLVVQSEEDVDGVCASARSLQAQAYGEWELCVACGEKLGPACRDMLRASFDNLSAQIKVIPSNGALSREEAWNSLLRKTSASFVGILDPGDRLAGNALFEVARQFVADQTVRLVYGDEDVALLGGSRGEPVFKPDWSPDLLLATNYIGRPWFARRDDVVALGGMAAEFPKYAEYDLLLRVTELEGSIAHVRTVICTRLERTWGKADQHDGTAMGTVLLAALRRRSIEGDVVESDCPGTVRIRRSIRGTPRISIIIPTTGAEGHLARCLRSIVEKTAYPTYEVILVDTSRGCVVRDQAAAFRTADLKLIALAGPFNWARACNVGAGRASGDYLLFLNDDTEVVTPDWISALLEHAQRPDVGAVGAKLLYPDGTVQHGGVFLVAAGGGARHAFRCVSDAEAGYCGLLRVTRNCSAVTGAAMLVSRRVFELMNRFDENYQIEGSDLDFCLRARREKRLIVWTPYSVLYHREAATRHSIRGVTQGDVELLWKRWGDVLRGGDAYYSPNLSQSRDDFGVQEHPIVVRAARHPLLDAQSIRRILVIKLDHLGDVVLSLPALRRLHEVFPEAEITMLVGPWAATLLNGETSVSRVLTYSFFDADSSQPPKQDRAELETLGASLRSMRFDLAVDLRRHPETRQILRASGARYTVGFMTGGDDSWLTLRVPCEDDQPRRRPALHITDQLASLVEAIRTAADGGALPKLNHAREGIGSAPTTAPSHRPSDARIVVGIHPGCGQAIRRWPTEYFAEFADLGVDRLGARVVLFGGQQELALAEAVREQMKNREHAVILVGRGPISSFMKEVRQCSVFVGNNSGPVHIAAALGIPSVGIYAGTSDPWEWAPLGPNALCVSRACDLSPCYFGDSQLCPLDVDCLRRLEVSFVWEAALRVLGTATQQSGAGSEGCGKYPATGSCPLDVGGQAM